LQEGEKLLKFFSLGDNFISSANGTPKKMDKKSKNTSNRDKKNKKGQDRVYEKGIAEFILEQDKESTRDPVQEAHDKYYSNDTSSEEAPKEPLPKITEIDEDTYDENAPAVLEKNTGEEDSKMVLLVKGKNSEDNIEIEQEELARFEEAREEREVMEFEAELLRKKKEKLVEGERGELDRYNEKLALKKAGGKLGVNKGTGGKTKEEKDAKRKAKKEKEMLARKLAKGTAHGQAKDKEPVDPENENRNIVSDQNIADVAPGTETPLEIPEEAPEENAAAKKKKASKEKK
jgi:hypothetical protein